MDRHLARILKLTSCTEITFRGSDEDGDYTSVEIKSPEQRDLLFAFIRKAVKDEVPALTKPEPLDI